jgi:hypothetical protein
MLWDFWDDKRFLATLVALMAIAAVAIVLLTGGGDDPVSTVASPELAAEPEDERVDASAPDKDRSSSDRKGEGDAPGGDGSTRRDHDGGAPGEADDRQGDSAEPAQGPTAQEGTSVKDSPPSCPTSATNAAGSGECAPQEGPQGGSPNPSKPGTAASHGSDDSSTQGVSKPTTSLAQEGEVQGGNSGGPNTAVGQAGD